MLNQNEEQEFRDLLKEIDNLVFTPGTIVQAVFGAMIGYARFVFGIGRDVELPIFAVIAAYNAAAGIDASAREGSFDTKLEPMMALFMSSLKTAILASDVPEERIGAEQLRAMIDTLNKFGREIDDPKLKCRALDEARRLRNIAARHATLN